MAKTKEYPRMFQMLHHSLTRKGAILPNKVYTTRESSLFPYKGNWVIVTLE